MVEYAYYLKALSYYEQIVDVERDAEMTLLALNAFDDLLLRYPDSTYGRDARLKADLARSHLAGKEMAVGRFYVERRHHAAALRRFERVVREYQTSNQVPEALYRMVEAYLALGLIEEAGRVGSVAVYNYPDPSGRASSWLLPMTRKDRFQKVYSSARLIPSPRFLMSSDAAQPDRIQHRPDRTSDAFL